MKKTTNYTFYIFLFVFCICINCEYQTIGQESELNKTDKNSLSCDIEVSSRTVEPYLPLFLNVIFSNKSSRTKNITAQWFPKLKFNYEGKWNIYHAKNTPNRNPRPPKQKKLKKGQQKQWALSIDIDRSIGHLFSEPGKRTIQIKLGNIGNIECSPITIRVKKVTGDDKKALQIIRKKKLYKFFTQDFYYRFDDFNSNTIESFKQLVKKYPDSVYSDHARLAIARLYLHGGEFNDDLDKTIKRFKPEDFEEAYLEEAINWFNRSIKNGSPQLAARARYYLAMIYRKTGKWNKAKNQIKKGLSGSPDPYFKYKLKQLKKSSKPRFERTKRPEHPGVGSPKRKKRDNKLREFFVAAMLWKATAQSRLDDYTRTGEKDEWVHDFWGYHGIKQEDGTVLNAIPEVVAKADWSPADSYPDGIQVKPFPESGPEPFKGYYFCMFPYYQENGERVPYDPDGSGTHPTRVGFMAFPAAYPEIGRYAYILDYKGGMFKIDALKGGFNTGAGPPVSSEGTPPVKTMPANPEEEGYFELSRSDWEKEKWKGIYKKWLKKHK